MSLSSKKLAQLLDADSGSPDPSEEIKRCADCELERALPNNSYCSECSAERKTEANKANGRANGHATAPTRFSEVKFCANCKSIPVDREYGQGKWCAVCVEMLCNQCNQRIGVYGRKGDSYCEPCWAVKRASLNPKQKKIMERQRQKSKPLVDHEENYRGLCKSGCGAQVDGEYNCQACKAKAAEVNFKLEPGEVELWRGNVGKPEDKMVKQVVARKASSIEPEEMTWVWEHRIPDATITWILGQPNNAKSLMTIEIAACATTGRQWPDGTPNELGAVKVLMFCGEDSLSKVVIPRLMAAGANLDNVEFLDNKSFRGTCGDSKMPGRSIDLSQDFETLMGMLKANPGYKIIIADPITGIWGDADMAKDKEINPLLEELVIFCEIGKIAFIGVAHTPKRTTNSAIEKIPGGSAVGGKAKSGFMLSRDPDSDDNHDHLLTMIKWNYTGKSSGMRYKTVGTEIEHNGKTFKTAKIKWGEATDMVADDVLVAQNSKKEEKDRQLDRCMSFLQTYLKDGPKRSPDVYAAAVQLEFGDTTVKRALKKLGGDHLDRRNKREGYWMTLTPGVPFPEPKPEPEQQQMALAANEEL